MIAVQPTGPNMGEIVWQWEALDHVVQDFDPVANNFGIVADHPELIDINFAANAGTDWLHVNGIDYQADLDQVVQRIAETGTNCRTTWRAMQTTELPRRVQAQQAVALRLVCGPPSLISA